MPWWGILLIVLGSLLVGGVGVYLWLAYQFGKSFSQGF